jgi:hypothetical protein
MLGSLTMGVLFASILGGFWILVRGNGKKKTSKKEKGTDDGKN